MVAKTMYESKRSLRKRLMKFYAISEAYWRKQQRDYSSQDAVTRYVSDRRVKGILEYANPKGASCVIDVGCGIGRLLEEFSGISEVEIVGCDISTLALRIAKDRSPSSLLVRCDAEELPFRDESCEVCLCCDVLEHLVDPARALREIIRISRNKGFIVLTVPNVTPQQKLYAKMYGLSKSGKEQTSEENLTMHLHEFTLHRLKRLLRQTGTVSIINIQTDSVVRTLPLFFRLLSDNRARWAKRLDELLSRMLVAFGGTLILKTQKIEKKCLT